MRWENKNTQYTLGNKCAKNGCKQTILVQLIILDTVYSCFFESEVSEMLHSAFVKSVTIR